MKDEFLWAQKYRPRKVSDSILPDDLKTTFQGFVDKGNVPNLILSGRPGVGKTTLALAMLEEIGSDYLMINGSLDAGIDTLRNEIANFASSLSLGGGRKFVILDEADYLSATKVQPALRGFVEEFSNNCGFILTCNYRNRIIPALSESRFSVINFDSGFEPKPRLLKKLHARLREILEAEGITYDDQAVAALMMKFFPDFRRILNELQLYASGGKIDSGVLVAFEDTEIDSVVDMIKTQNFDALRRWVAENKDIDQNALMSRLYKKLSELLATVALAEVVVILSKYMAQSTMVADKEINIAACLADILIAEPEFK